MYFARKICPTRWKIERRPSWPALTCPKSACASVSRLAVSLRASAEMRIKNLGSRAPLTFTFSRSTALTSLMHHAAFQRKLENYTLNQINSLRFANPKVAPSKYCSRSTCGRLALIKCGVCNQACYCSIPCRVRHWQEHKHFCKSTHQKPP